MKNNKTISMKVTSCIIEAAFVDPFFRDLENLFLKINVVSNKFTIKDQDIIKHENSMIENTK